jgi:GNAT superfamily N-acetyltransferase
MNFEIKVEMLPVNKKTLTEYCAIPSFFVVDSFFEAEIQGEGFGGITFCERKVKKPFTKYYGEREEPLTWLRFDTTNWVIFIVRNGDAAVGGLTLACKTPEIRILNGRDDLADVWDIRVHPDYRHRGIGTVLFQKAIDWSRGKSYRQLCVETQNVNVHACRFYVKQGCRLGAINRYAYYTSPEDMDEVQLIWFLNL